MGGRFRTTGISVIPQVPWGSYLLCFHETLDDLFHVLFLFIDAGLKNHEKCLLIARVRPGHPIHKITDFPEISTLAPYLETGQLEICQNLEIFVENGAVNEEKYFNFLNDRLDNALKMGYDGLRIAGDVTWLGINKWNSAFIHRTRFLRLFPRSRILRLSTFPLSKLSAHEMVTVMSKLKYVFITRNGKLSLLGGAGRPQSETLKQKEAQYLTQISRYKKINEEETQYLDNAAVILLALDAEGKVTHINQKGCEVLGYKRSEIIGKNWFDSFIPPDLKKELLSLFGELLSSDIKVPFFHENPVLTKAGGEISIAWYTRVIKDDLGNNVSIFTTGVDVIERKQAQKIQGEQPLPPVVRYLTPLQEKYIDAGLQELDDPGILELIFTQYMPPADARELAKTCIEQYGTLRELLAAPVLNLQHLGIPRNCIFALKLIHELPLRFLKEEIQNKAVFSSSQDIFNYLYFSMRDLKKEVFKVMYLNVRNQIIDVVDLFTGSQDKIHLDARVVVEKSLEQESRSLIVVHNHPSGDPTPSTADKRFTRDLVFVGSILQINVLDHIVIGQNSYFSFAAEGLIKEYELDFSKLRLTGTSEARERLRKARKKE